MSEYWGWALGIQAAAAVGTLLAVVVAIWGDKVRSVLAPPALSVRLRDREGELTTQLNGTKVRYYHLVVSNSRRWAPARNVVVFITRVDRPGPDGVWQSAMPSGPVPMVWQFGLPASTIGRERFCDIAHVAVGGFRLATLFTPNNFPADLPGPGRLRCEFVAVADNAESRPCAVEFNWNGQWVEGSTEMAQCLVVK